jgi:hypothetical protein
MRVVQLSLIMVGCAVIAACGNQEREARREAPKVSHSVRAQTIRPSARFFERTVYGDAGGGFVDTLRGAFDWSKRVGWAVREGPGSLELIQIGARCYERWPPGAWRERVAGDVEGLCDAAIFSNPATEFDLFSSVGDLTRVGRGRVHGVATTRFRIQLNVGAVKGPLELWVDKDGVVRRSRQQGESSADFLAVRDYLDFGVDVHVRPPRGKHTELKELIQGDG